ncbi:RHS repeat-associated core domain protein [Chitinispirillum alkaliphilum]|nr:RHS repeat-associated core domain protein [Chitinispirillum alkaliphilum]
MINKKTLIVQIIFLLAVANLYSAVSVDVYVRDERLGYNNISNPRIYLHNTGTETLTSLHYYYYFSTENGNVPMIMRDFLPVETATIEHVSGDLYRVKYSVSGVAVAPGGYLPENGSNVIGLHYNDWSEWDKTNDFSNPGSSEYVKTENIAVYVNNVRIHGKEPGDDPDDPDPALPVLTSFALFSTEQTTIQSQSVFSGFGAVGSNNQVNIQSEVIVEGNVICGGDVHIGALSAIKGNVMLNGELIKDGSSTINGNIITDYNFAGITIPQIEVLPGADSVFVNAEETRILSPGAYSDVFLHSRGNLILSSGTYRFSSLFLHSESGIYLNVNPGENVEILVSGNLGFHDRSVLNFSNEGYASDVKLYTNSNSMVLIGHETDIEGIIYAPHAEVLVRSRAKVKGALYAKKIRMEAGVSFEGSVLDPFGDENENGVTNFIEVLFGTDPFDSTDFPYYAWVTEYSDFDNRNEQMVYYDFSRFYSDYIDASSVPVTFPAGFLRSAGLPPVYRVLNKPSSIPAITKNDIDQHLDGKYEGYMPVGRYFEMYANSPAGNGPMLLPIPIPADELVLPPNLAVAQYRANSPERWHIDEISYVEGNVAYFESRSFGPAILIHKTAQTVMYSDNSVYSSSFENVGVSVQIELLNTLAVNEELSLEIMYSDASSGQFQLQDPITERFESFDGSAYLMKQFIFSGPVLIHSLSVESIADDVLYTYENQFLAEPGACLNIEFYGNISSLRENTTVNDPIVVTNSSALSLEYVPISGEGIIRKNRTTGSGEYEYSYNYYLKDHLGSTRMVINDQNMVTEAVGYKPYGAMVGIPGIETSSELPVRVKFTGKEFDDEGGINAYHFGARLYDPEIGRWLSTDELEQFFDKYLYSHVNPVNFIDVDGRWSPLIHFFHGAYYAVKPDIGEKGWTWWPGVDDNYVDESKKMHRIQHDMRKLYEYGRGDKPAGLSDREWRGMKRHAYGDFFHHGSRGMSFSPLERLAERLGGADGREMFQDVQCLWILSWFAPPAFTTLLGINWAISMLNSRAAVRGLEMMINRGVYVRGDLDGNPRPTINYGQWRYRRDNLAPRGFIELYDYDY